MTNVLEHDIDKSEPYVTYQWILDQPGWREESPGNLVYVNSQIYVRNGWIYLRAGKIMLEYKPTEVTCRWLKEVLAEL